MESKTTSQKGENDKVSRAEFLIPIIAVILVGTLWWICYRYITANYGIKDDGTIDWSIRGQVGDLFGAVNALFSGLAFAGIIYTIYLQRQELKAQRKELELTRAEFTKQNRTFKRQRFENTFFNLLEAHNQIVSSLRLSYIDQEYEGRAFFIGLKLLLRQTLSSRDLDTDSNNNENVMRQGYGIMKQRYFKTYLLLYLNSLKTVISLVKSSPLIADKERNFLRVSPIRVFD